MTVTRGLTTTSPARFTAENAPRVRAHEAAMADHYRALAAEATDPVQAEALTRIAESHERITARAADALKRF
jgi:hypothetical protein